MIGSGVRHSALALLLCGACLNFAPAAAQTGAAFQPGPVFTEFGNVASVDSDMPIPPGTHFKILFDGSQGADSGKLNQTINSAARFINMTVAAGVPVDNIEVAIVLHGSAGWDVTDDEAYGAKHEGKANGSAKAVKALLHHGVRIYLCGQSAAGLGIANEDLLPGVQMALSAMVADALLQQEGYTLNPF